MKKTFILVLLVLCLSLAPVFADGMAAGVVAGYPGIGAEFDYTINDTLTAYGQVGCDAITPLVNNFLSNFSNKYTSGTKATWNFGGGVDYKFWAIDYEEQNYGRIYPISVGAQAKITYDPNKTEKKWGFKALANLKSELDFSINGLPFKSFGRVGVGLAKNTGDTGFATVGSFAVIAEGQVGLLLRF